MNASVFDIYKGTTTDGPGIRDTVFFQGCPLSCKWCHNPEGIDVKNHMWYEMRTCIGCGICEKTCQSGAVKLTEGGVKILPGLCVMCGCCEEACPTRSLKRIAREYTVEELTGEIVKDKEYFEMSGGGVTASGGEAMLHAEFLCDFFAEMRRRGIHTALDTTGYCGKDKLFAVLARTDMVLYDLKVLDSLLHRTFTGTDNGIILDNIIKIAEYIREGGNLRLWIRTPVIPGFTDREEIISDIARFIKNNLSGAVQRWELCAFNNSCGHKYEKLGRRWELADAELISKEKMGCLEHIAKAADVEEIVCSGVTRE